jgi:hypothetical protein
MNETTNEYNEARAILRDFRGALASLSAADRANIAAQSEEENIYDERVHARLD